MAASAAAGKKEEVLSFRLGEEEYGISILKVQEIRGYDAVTKIANSAAYIKVRIEGHAAGAPRAGLKPVKAKARAPLHSLPGRAEKKAVFAPQRKLVANGAKEWEEF